MLSEAFLSTIMYEKTMDNNCRKDKTHKKHPSLKCPQNNKQERHGCWIKYAGEGACSCGEEGNSHEWVSAVSSSQAMVIPNRDLAASGSLDLYTSWSSMYASIYKNYPDLHIGGDHILNKKDSGCVLECEDGPVLLSVDIDSSSPPNDLPNMPPEEEVLPSEDSNALPSAPSSNSMLNGFLERKMQELYAEALVANGSPNPRWPNILMVNLNQMSLLLSQEQKMDQARAREAILQYLCSATSGVSSEFITPVLHISSQGSKKKSSNLSKKLRSQK